MRLRCAWNVLPCAAALRVLFGGDVETEGRGCQKVAIVLAVRWLGAVRR